MYILGVSFHYPIVKVRPGIQLVSVADEPMLVKVDSACQGLGPSLTPYDLRPELADRGQAYPDPDSAISRAMRAL